MSPMVKPKKPTAAPDLTKEEALKKLASAERRLGKAKVAAAESIKKAEEMAVKAKVLQRELTRVRNEAKKDIENQREKLEEKFRDQIKGLKGTIATHEGEIAKLKGEKEAADKKAVDAGKRVSGFENEIMRLKWHVQAANEKTKLQGGEDGKDRAIAELKATLEGREKEIRALREAAGSVRPNTAPAPRLEEMASVLAPESTSEKIPELKNDPEPSGESDEAEPESPPKQEPPPHVSPPSESEPA